MKNKEERFRQINAVIETLKDARPLCEDPATALLVISALEGAQTLQQMMVEGEWPDLAESHLPGAPVVPALPGDVFGADAAEFCFPV